MQLQEKCIMVSWLICTLMIFLRAKFVSELLESRGTTVVYSQPPNGVDVT